MFITKIPKEKVTTTLLSYSYKDTDKGDRSGWIYIIPNPLRKRTFPNIGTWRGFIIESQNKTQIKRQLFSVQ
jgi:hypothetical protein